MFRRVLIAALVASALMFQWGFVFWGLSGAPTMMMQPLPETAQSDVAAALRHDKVPSGMYIYPMPAKPGDAEAMKAAEQQSREGPRFLLAHHREGGEPMDAKVMAAGFVHMFVVALVLAILTAMVLPALKSFGSRFAFVALAGVLGSIWTNPGDMVWWFHSPQYCLGQIVYGVVSGILAAIAIAAIVKPTAKGFEKSGF